MIGELRPGALPWEEPEAWVGPPLPPSLMSCHTHLGSLGGGQDQEAPLFPFFPLLLHPVQRRTRDKEPSLASHCLLSEEKPKLQEGQILVHDL